MWFNAYQHAAAQVTLQELKDTAGDKLQNRQTVSLIFGDRVGKWSVAPPVLAWSELCPLHLRVESLASVLPITMGVSVAFRTLWSKVLGRTVGCGRCEAFG